MKYECHVENRALNRLVLDYLKENGKTEEETDCTIEL